MNDFQSVVLRDSNGQNWLVRVYHDEGIRQLYTTPTDDVGEDSVRIKSFSGEFKLKIGTNGQIVTYPVDSIN